MREVVFIKTNETYWNQFEDFIKGKAELTPDELANFYIRITDDLSYAKTFYPKSNALIHYLNELAINAHKNIYKGKKEKKSRFKDFFITELPLVIRSCHKELSYSLVIFCVAICIGFFSSLKDSTFPNLILGDSYVNMTIDNIENGDPLGVYGSSSETPMFLGIAANNVRVAFFAFIVGIFSALATGIILFLNGIMVGAFMTFFIEKGLGWLSFSTIMIHGTLELSAIVIAGGAGMVLGNSWLFPGTYPRAFNFRQSANKALKIVVGLIPVFVFASFLESYVTRHYFVLGSFGRLSIIVASAAFIIWYYIFYPIKIERYGQSTKNTIT